MAYMLLFGFAALFDSAASLHNVHMHNARGAGAWVLGGSCCHLSTPHHSVAYIDNITRQLTSTWRVFPSDRHVLERGEAGVHVERTHYLLSWEGSLCGDCLTLWHGCN